MIDTLVKNMKQPSHEQKSQPEDVVMKTEEGSDECENVMIVLQKLCQQAAEKQAEVDAFLEGMPEH